MKRVWARVLQFSLACALVFGLLAANLHHAHSISDQHHDHVNCELCIASSVLDHGIALGAFIVALAAVRFVWIRCAPAKRIIYRSQNYFLFNSALDPPLA